LKYTDIRIIFSQAGGTMPFLIERLVNLAKTPQYATQPPKDFLAEAVSFTMRYRSGIERGGDVGAAEGCAGRHREFVSLQAGHL
jgi:hypothetical protein